MDKVFYPPVENATLRVLSLGAGVQSTTLALLAAHGEVGPMPDCAIFADTGAEPKEVYEHLAWMMGGNVLPFPVHIVSAGNIIDSLHEMRKGNRWASIPAFTVDKTGRAAPMTRQCTKEYKIEPIRAKVRELLGVAKGERVPKGIIVEQWIGISTDEMLRVKRSQDAWCVNRYPLIDLNMSRRDCIDWLAKHGYPEPPKSSCSFCPFHDDAMWRFIRDNQPDAWAEAVEVDRLIRDGAPDTETRKGTGKMYLHRSLKPLDEVDFSTKEERGQLLIWNNECEGMCGV